MSAPGVAFEVLARDGAARRGRLTTAHGTVNTPAFMAVGTAGSVKGLTPEEIAATGTEIVLGNTYHLMLRPGPERIARLGGLHRFMSWPNPILTDSGGYQVMSLADLRQITEDGVTFKSHLDGSRYALTPERAVEIQALLGADIAMVLDECTPHPVDEGRAAESMRRSLRWAERSLAAFEARPGHGLFGIVQGAMVPELRRESAAGLVAMGFDGYALGGLAVGEGRETRLQMIEETVPALPAARPRYLMGVGKPADLVEAAARGIDMFDCVLPTRSGRTGQAFTRRGTLNMRNARHREDPRAVDPDCGCATCRNHGRAYLHHLFRAGEMLGPVLLTRHNLYYYQELMAALRGAIEAGRLADFIVVFGSQQAEGDIEPIA
ncbi:MAG: tRNA guanosine(34) transglycosylase Tgt [Proteobacteria bacterium]|nr:tRNA guanosine(34) transglycosylase Tgt [Pseudomonadota bacterium]